MHLRNVVSTVLAASVVSAVPLTDVLSQNNGTLSTLSKLLSTVPDVVQALGQAENITIIAPSNDAFTNFMKMNPSASSIVADTNTLTAVLQYHVLSGMFMSSAINTTPNFATTLLTSSAFTNVTGGQKVALQLLNGMPSVLSGFKQQSKVDKADIMFDNGVLHIVDSVLMIPASPAETAIDTGLTAVAGALSKVNLVGPLNGLRDATVFAPSNDAFKAVDSVVEGASMADLNNVLRYHVVIGQVDFSTMIAMGNMPMTLQTALGETLTVRTENGEVFVNSAKVILPDIITSNGVVHVIDNVLNPAATTLTPDASKATQTPAFSGASSASDVPFTSSIKPTTTLVPAGASGAGAAGAMPTAAVLGLLGGAAILANL